MAAHGSRARERADRLNESPSEKEGKYPLARRHAMNSIASMKALPKRKGNGRGWSVQKTPRSLNESPSQKEGKSADAGCMGGWCLRASMKALPKRKGNAVLVSHISKMRAPQ